MPVYFLNADFDYRNLLDFTAPDPDCLHTVIGVVVEMVLVVEMVVMLMVEMVLVVIMTIGKLVCFRVSTCDDDCIMMAMAIC